MAAEEPTKMRDAAIALHDFGLLPLDLRTAEEHSYFGTPEEMAKFHRLIEVLCGRGLEGIDGKDTDQCIQQQLSDAADARTAAACSEPSMLARIINRIFLLIGADLSPGRKPLLW